ncbi:DNA-directed RNA polymerase subunit [Favolaschia claudopus]|uniref:DNA-directed RNA polymerase subunit n=1 Tax=Favolaschia claudopus TaxID=2862362 RepID=A0AAW0AFX9_9AGAR
MVGAHKIGSLLFCPRCGTLLELPKDGEVDVTCEQCGHVEPASSYENIEITTRSDPDAFPSALRQKRKTQTKLHDSGNQGTLVSEAYSKEIQLRSVDEGTTIFLQCTTCNHGWRVNN